MTSAFRFVLVLVLGFVLASAARGSQGPKVDPAVGAWLADVRTQLRAECQQVDNALAKEGEKFPRADLLAAYGRSAAAAGQFRQSAAAYAMFLSEFGLDHAYSEQILARFGASLAPLDLDSVDVLHTAGGPRYQPTWRMGNAASPEQLRLAVGAYELLAGVAKDKQVSAKALFALGWVHRALNDWIASTAAWDRTADVAKDSVVGADALWHAADNLAWTGQPAESAKRLRRLAAEHRDDGRQHAVADRIESLDAESKRTGKWFEDPVASLRQEIADRAAQRKPEEVYRSAIQWLQARRDTAATVTISRWATTQNSWPIQARLSAHLDLVDALLRQTPADDNAKIEAAEVLAKVVAMAPSDDWAIPAAIRRSRLLSGLKQFDAADDSLSGIEARWKGNPQWEPSVLIERMQSLVERGKLGEARALQEECRSRYPDYELPAELAATLATVKNGGGR